MHHPAKLLLTLSVVSLLIGGHAGWASAQAQTAPDTRASQAPESDVQGLQPAERPDSQLSPGTTGFRTTSEPQPIAYRCGMGSGSMMGGPAAAVMVFLGGALFLASIAALVALTVFLIRRSRVRPHV